MTRPAEVIIERGAPSRTSTKREWCSACGHALRAEGETRIAGYTLCATCGEALLQKVFFSRPRWTALAPRGGGIS